MSAQELPTTGFCVNIFNKLIRYTVLQYITTCLTIMIIMADLFQAGQDGSKFISSARTNSQLLSTVDFFYCILVAMLDTTELDHLDHLDHQVTLPAPTIASPCHHSGPLLIRTWLMDALSTHHPAPFGEGALSQISKARANHLRTLECSSRQRSRKTTRTWQPQRRNGKLQAALVFLSFFILGTC